MQKGAAKSKHSKSKNNIGMPEGYVSPARKKFSQQSIRQFKIEIDHEIAKCLDTLDRQGLKFLKETLKTSNLFNSTNFQVDNENAKYETQNSKINLDKPQNVKIPTKMLDKYYASMEDEIAQTQISGKKVSPKKKNQQSNTHLKNQLSQVKKQQSYISETKPQKQLNPSKNQKESAATNTQKESTQPNKSFNKNHRSSSSVKFNKTKEAYQVEEMQKGKEKKYESAQTKSTTQVKEKQIVNAGSRVTKKTVIQNKKTNEKISLGQRLSKKMQELHISKVGPTKKASNPTTKSKNTATNKNAFKNSEASQMPEQMIEQEIVQGIQNESLINDPNFQDIRQSIVNESIVQKSSILQPESKHSFVKISQKVNPLKPIGKDKQLYTPGIQQNKSIKIEQSKQEFQNSQVSESKFLPNQFSSINNQQNDVEKLSMSIQVDKVQLEKNSFQSSLDKEKFVEMSHIVQKINKLSPHKLMEIQKYIDFIEKTPFQHIKSPESVIPSQTETNQQNQSQFLYPGKTSLIKNKSETFENNWIERQKKQERPSTKLENENHQVGKQSIIHVNSKSPLSFQRNDSRKGNREKKEKASMIFGSNSKSGSRSRIKIDVDFEEEKEKPKQSNFKAQSNASLQNPYIKLKSNYDPENKDRDRQAILTQQKPIKMEKIDYNQPVKNMNLPSETKVNMNSSNFNLSNIQKHLKSENKIQIQQENLSPSVPLKEEKLLSNRQSQLIISQQNQSEVQDTSLNIEYTEVKMLNISNKRSMVRQVQQTRTKLKFKILSNRGHPSLFGLTGIQLFTIDSRRVVITDKQLGLNSTSSSKLLNLFNGNHRNLKDDYFYQSALSKNEIIVELDKQNDKIGGILIFNFNKSSLESQKQVDELQVYHNDAKMWKGSINPGSYNQNNDYATKIQFIQNFKFPNFQMSNKSFTLAPTQKKLIQKPQSLISSQKPEIKIAPILMHQEEKKLEQPQIQRRRNESQFSSKNFKLTDSIQSFKGWDLNNQVKNNNIKIYNSSNAPNIAKTQKRSNYDDFDSMLNCLEQNIQREKSKSKIGIFLPVSNDFQIVAAKNNSKVQNKQEIKSLNRNRSEKDEISNMKTEKKTTNQEIEDFVNASIFKDKSKPSFVSQQNENSYHTQKYQSRTNKNTKIQETFQSKNTKINIDDFLGELDDVMNNKDESRKNKQPSKQIQIPNLPSGNLVELEILQNWGHQALVGIHAIQFFNDQGTLFFPTKIESNKNHQNINLIQTSNNKNIMSRDQKVQTKLGFDKKSITTLSFVFPSNQKFSLIRIWNYNGHRVHSNIGVKLCVIKVNGKEVFIGEIKRNESTPQNFHKYFDPILFTNDKKIINRIKENDWLTELKNKSKQQKQLFKSTLINFNRPKTRNSEKNSSTKENHDISSSKNQKQIKLPKRQCWQYQPPQIPKGNLLVFLLHDTWGDQNFIGLNGIQIFDSEGKLLAKDNISKIKAFPNSTGQKNDKRVVENLINGNNLSSVDTNIWLSTYQSDIEKIETGKPNMIVIELVKRTKISGINIFNYSKTPQRGVREIQIQVNNLIAFRGYVKMFDEKSGENCFHTTINFTKNVELLAKMNYESYNEDNIDQNVMHVNERKLIKA